MANIDLDALVDAETLQKQLATENETCKQTSVRSPLRFCEDRHAKRDLSEAPGRLARSKTM